MTIHLKHEHALKKGKKNILPRERDMQWLMLNKVKLNIKTEQRYTNNYTLLDTYIDVHSWSGFP